MKQTPSHHVLRTVILFIILLFCININGQDLMKKQSPKHYLSNNLNS